MLGLGILELFVCFTRLWFKCTHKCSGNFFTNFEAGKIYNWRFGLQNRVLSNFCIDFCKKKQAVRFTKKKTFKSSLKENSVAPLQLMIHLLVSNRWLGTGLLMTGATKLSKLSETMVLVRAAAILKMSQLKQVVMETWRQKKDQTQTFSSRELWEELETILQCTCCLLWRNREEFLFALVWTNNWIFLQ